MQPISRWLRLVAICTAVTALTACVVYPQDGYRSGPSQAGYHQPANSYPQPGYPAATYPAVQGIYNGYAQQAQVLTVETVRVQDGSGVGAGGAIVGGVLGGVLGHQIGGGSGKDLATIAGVVGGALAGHAVQGSIGGGSVRDVYRVTVQTQDGNVRVFDYAYAPDFRPGDYVRIDGNQIYR